MVSQDIFCPRFLCLEASFFLCTGLLVTHECLLCPSFLISSFVVILCRNSRTALFFDRFICRQKLRYGFFRFRRHTIIYVCLWVGLILSLFCSASVRVCSGSLRFFVSNRGDSVCRSSRMLLLRLVAFLFPAFFNGVMLSSFLYHMAGSNLFDKWTEVVS